MNQFHVEQKRTKYVRGWPTPSQKPWSVYKNDRYIASFATRSKAEAWIEKYETSGNVGDAP